MTSTCTLPSLRLTEHHEGVLSTDDCAALERHLAECADCGGLRDDLEALARLCRRARGEKVTMPPGLRARIEGMLLGEGASPAPGPSLPAPSAPRPQG
jgi:predicted anti-sigma-YlaC factor YlaD